MASQSSVIDGVLKSAIACFTGLKTGHISNYRLRLFLLSVTVAAMPWNVICADTWYIDRNAAETGDGTSWASAFRNLPEALGAAQASVGGDVIRVAAGVYPVFEIASPPLQVPDGTSLTGGMLPSANASPESDETLFDLHVPGFPSSPRIAVGNQCAFTRVTFANSSGIGLGIDLWSHDITILDSKFVGNFDGVGNCL